MHGCMHVHKQTLVQKYDFYSTLKHACKHDFVNVRIDANSNAQMAKVRNAKEAFLPALFSISTFILSPAKSRLSKASLQRE